MTRLNIGCGNQILEGYCNIDINNPKADFDWDIRIPLPYKDNSIDEIKAIAVLEHFNKYEHIKIFQDWVRVLKRFGVLEVKVPDVGYICSMNDIDIAEKINLLYGDPEFEELNLGDAGSHKWGFTYATLSKLFIDNGMNISDYKQSSDLLNITIMGVKP